MRHAARAAALAGFFALTLAAQDSDREHATQLMTSATALAAQKGPDALHQASASFEGAAALWQKTGDQDKQFEALSAAAWAHFPLQEFAEMSRLLEQAVAVGGPRAQVFRANALTSYSAIHSTQGDFPKAIADLQEARGMFRQLGDKPMERQAIAFEANVYTLQAGAQEKGQDNTAAVQSLDQAAALYGDAGYPGVAGNVLLKAGQLTAAPFTPKAWEAAAGYYMRAVALLQAAGNHAGEATAWFRLGDLADSLQQFERSRDDYLKVVPFLAELKAVGVDGLTYKGLGDAENNLGRLPEAVEYYRKALPGLAAAKNGVQEYLAGMRLAKALQALKRYPEALQAFSDVAKSSHEGGNAADEAVALGSIGILQLQERHWQPALEAFTAEQKLRASLGNRESESLSWTSIAAVYQNRGEYQAKLRADQRALDLLEGSSEKAQRRAALRAVGDSYNSLHNAPKALDFLNQALAMSGDDPEFRAGVLVEIGEVCYGDSRLDDALKFENQALDLALPLGQPAFAERIRTDIGLALLAKGEPSKARAIFEQIVAGARDRNDIQHQTSGMHNLGKLVQDSGDNDQAEKLYLKALRLARADGEREQEAITMRSLGMVYHAQAREEEAVETLQRALALDRDLESPYGESTDLNNLGLVYADLGQPQKGLDAFNQALTLMRDLGDENGVASQLRNLGGIYQGLGDYSGAAAYFNRALDTQKAVGDEIGQAYTHNSLGVLLIASEDNWEAALREFAMALPVIRKYDDRAGEASVLSNMANASISAGNFAEAVRQEQEALRVAREIHNPDSEGLALHGLGSAWEAAGDLDRALESTKAARELWRRLHYVSGEAKSDSLIARIEKRQGRTDDALADAREAIRLLDEQRGGLSSEDQRAYYLATVASPVPLTIELLMEKHRLDPTKGYDRQAFETSEAARARSLVELLAAARANVRKDADPALLTRKMGVDRSLSAKAALLTKLPDGEDFRKVQVEFQDLTAERDRLEARMRAGRPRDAALTAAQVQTQVLDAKTSLLEYSLGEDRSFLFVVTRTSFRTFELPARKAIDAAVNDFLEEVSQRRPGRTAFPAAVALGHLLLDPAAGLAGRRLMIVGDGSLSGIPFAALPDPSSGKPLIAGHEMVTESSAAAVLELRRETAGRKRAPRGLAVIADPVFEREDDRFGNAAAAPAEIPADLLHAAVAGATRDGESGIVRLPHTREEADAITALAAGGRPLKLLGFEADKAAVMGDRLAPFRLVHFATHGLVDDRHPQLSGLVLSTWDAKGSPQDGFLRLTDIFGMKLGADLVVLSACKSGRGQLVAGEGMLGMTRGFLYAGARSLVVSLWEVDDRATAQLMSRFYREMLRAPHERPAAALRAAQVWMLSNSEWRDPYYWAAFTFGGEWE